MSVIRFATPIDGADLATIYAPAVIERATSFELEAPDAAEMGARTKKASWAPWLVYEEDGRVLGYAYGGKHRERAAYQWAVEVSAYVREDQHRRGIGRALYTSLFELLILQGFRSAFAGIVPPNAASFALHQSVGFTPLGVFHRIGYKHGMWHDVAWFERPLGAYDAKPSEPIPLETLRADPAYADRINTALAAGLSLIRMHD